MDQELEKNDLERQLQRLRQGLKQMGDDEVWGSLKALAQRVQTLHGAGQIGSHHQAEALYPSPALGSLPKDWHLNRRNLVQWLGGVTALLTGAACTRQPPEAIVTYARMPEHMVPGEPLFYATAYPFAGYGLGILAETHMGRPTKIEGNHRHPASLGATDPYAQAALLTLYDPDRAQSIMHQGRIAPWDRFVSALRQALNNARARGAGAIRVLTPTVTSPTLRTLLEQYSGQNPAVRWHQYDPVNFDRSKEGTRLAFGRPLSVRYDLAKADVILTLDADLFSMFPGKLAYAKQFAHRRTPKAQGAAMSRLYALTSTPSMTSAAADHHLLAKPEAIELFAHGLAQLLGLKPAREIRLEPRQQQWLAAAAQDLQAHPGRSLVAVDETQPASVHAVAHAIIWATLITP